MCDIFCVLCIIYIIYYLLCVSYYILYHHIISFSNLNTASSNVQIGIQTSLFQASIAPAIAQDLKIKYPSIDFDLVLEQDNAGIALEGASNVMGFETDTGGTLALEEDGVSNIQLEEFYDSLQIWNFNNQQLTIDTAFIKRVVGFEGDEIKIKDGDIYNNGTLIKFSNIPVNETKVDATYIVPSNSIFVLGDNRSNSIDSRIYGSVNINQIIGRAEYKIFPINEISNIND